MVLEGLPHAVMRKRAKNMEQNWVKSYDLCWGNNEKGFPDADLYYTKTELQYYIISHDILEELSGISLFTARIVRHLDMLFHHTHTHTHTHPHIEHFSVIFMGPRY